MTITRNVALVNPFDGSLSIFGCRIVETNNYLIFTFPNTDEKAPGQQIQIVNG